MHKPAFRLPPLSAVRAFEAAARLQSFTRAAQELDMTQAAVSYQIRQLEQRLGLPLFQRLPRQVVLTAAGQRLAPAVIEAFGALRSAFAGAVARSESELAITSLPTIASNWLVPRLGAFQLTHPELAVRLDTGVPLVDLAQGEFDVGIRSGRGEWPGLAADLLLPVEFTPLCGPDVSARLSSPRDLLALPRYGRGDWWRQWLQEAGVDTAALPHGPTVELSVEQFEVTAAVASGGVAISSPLFFSAELASGRLVQPFAHRARAGVDYWLAYPQAAQHSPKIRAFRQWLLEQARLTRAETA